jgi:hypothetical protein
MSVQFNCGLAYGYRVEDWNLGWLVDQKKTSDDYKEYLKISNELEKRLKDEFGVAVYDYGTDWATGEYLGSVVGIISTAVGFDQYDFPECKLVGITQPTEEQINLLNRAIAFLGPDNDKIKERGWHLYLYAC